VIYFREELTLSL